MGVVEYTRGVTSLVLIIVLALVLFMIWKKGRSVESELEEELAFDDDVAEREGDLPLEDTDDS